MTQQPFSRPGAIDLSGLKRPAPAQSADASGSSSGSPSGSSVPGGSAYAVQVTEQTFQGLLEASMTAPVVLVFFSESRAPGSAQLGRDVAAVADEYDGRFLAGLVDIDASPAIAQAMQIPQVPLLLVILDGRPATQPIPGMLSLEELRTLFQQLGQQLTAQGITGRHQPRSSAATADEDGAGGSDPRFAAADAALESGDVDAAVGEFQRLVDANPADHEAAQGLAMAKVLQRTQGVDPAQARAAADLAPEDVAAQGLASDVDLLDGRVDEAFTRLVDVVRRSAGDDRNAAREHLLSLFAAVGNDDPRVLRGRQNLASALF